MKAVEEKKLDPSNRDDIKALRKSVPKVLTIMMFISINT